MLLTSKAAAGITGAGLVALTASLQTFGGDLFTPESIAIGLSLVVGIDRIMSEGRALTNVVSNGVATMVVWPAPTGSVGRLHRPEVAWNHRLQR